MKIKKYVIQKSEDAACQEIDILIRTIMKTNSTPTKKGRSLVYYPARQYNGADNDMDNLRLIVRGNHESTNVKVEFEPLPDDNWRWTIANSAYTALTNALDIRYN